MAGPQSVIQYLGKYTHRVAISNNRIVAINNGKVTFKWKDYRKGIQNRLLTLDAQEFIGRFFRHVLPSGFYKIRYYGLLAVANGNKKEQCVLLINKPSHVPLLQGITVKQVLEFLDVKSKVPDSKWEKHNVFSSPRGELSKLIIRNKTMQKIGIKLIPDSLVLKIKKILEKESQKPLFLPEDRKMLETLYQHDVKKLQEILGQNLPWLKENN